MAESQPAVGHYRISAKLGAGAMGEVWRAIDTRLGREVAIKVLPAAVADDPLRLARLSREAQLLASLNHPGIAAIFGIEEGALVMELVEGPTLADRIADGPIPLEEALPLALQMADALASRTTTSGTVQNYSYTYDRWGNRWDQTATSGSGPQPNLSLNTSTNQIQDTCSNGPVAGHYCYDAAGNMTSDINHTYTYDAEGNVTEVDGGVNNGEV